MTHQAHDTHDRKMVLVLDGGSHINGASARIVLQAGCETFIQLNRDFFLTPPPAYTPFIHPHPLRG
ncbi:MAG: hypothetical protein DME08_24925 [Candidatus Rokuibacteriota bacterium]|nr:MAG: hypothetical protein DME08_24925 [Candidatus Rokubacteria bacterium]PYN95083.1 MAG: hypothetical protein DMD89_20170 [Candidatus Rokubacteria bacterium]